MKKQFATAVYLVALVVGTPKLVADCASSPWTSDNVNGVFTIVCPKVGVGTVTPANALHLVVANGIPNVPFKMESTGADSVSGISLKNDARNWHVRVDGTDGDKFKIFDANANFSRLTITTAGDVGIGTTAPTATLEVNGSFKATSVIGSVYQDIAEWVPATSDMSPGTVVTLNADRSNEVMPSSVPYDTAVAGVVSGQPGFLLGEGAASKEMIATTGRVKVHVTTENGPIRIGDLLTTSDKPGTAMKSVPFELGGTRIHRPGTLLGKALEPLASGDGDILVLLSLQ